MGDREEWRRRAYRIADYVVEHPWRTLALYLLVRFMSGVGQGLAEEVLR